MRHALSVLLLTFVAAIDMRGAEPDQWKGLKLGEASAEHAITVLGSPKSDELAELKMTHFHWAFTRLLSDEYKKRQFRVLTFLGAENFKTVALCFSPEGTLGAIVLEPDENNPIPADTLSKVYADATFERPTLDVYYYLVGLSVPHSAVIVADVRTDRKFAKGTPPGRVVKLSLVSKRLLDDTKRADAITRSLQ
jgi:hypothetical protein